MAASKRIYVAGHRGMVGAALVRALTRRGDAELLTCTHAEVDLRDQQQVRAWFAAERFDEVYLAAARVGGIHANASYPADFIYDNMMIEANVVHEAWRSGVPRLLFLGSSCIYPRMAPQPIVEQDLLAGQLEPTNEPYAVAKIAGIKLCESYNRQYGTDFRSVMPTNLYGRGDNYHPENSHVIPALLRRFHEAARDHTPEVAIWGTGKPRRDFLHVDDMAAACLHVMALETPRYRAHTAPMQSHLNVGSGRDVTIAGIATLIAQVCGYHGRVTFDTSKADGTPRKLLDIERMRQLGWQPRITLETGLQKTYDWFKEESDAATVRAR